MEFKRGALYRYSYDCWVMYVGVYGSLRPLAGSLLCPLEACWKMDVTDKGPLRVETVRSQVRFYLGTLFEYRWMLVSYCLYCLWMSFSFGGFTFREMFFNMSENVLIAWGPYAVTGVILLIFAAFYKRTRIVLNERWHRVATVGCMTAGSICQVVWMASFSPGATWDPSLTLAFAASILLVAAGTTFFRIEIDRAFGWSGARTTLVCTAGGAAILFAAYLVSARLPDWAYYAAAVALPTLTALALSKETRKYPASKYYTWGRDVELPIPRAFVITSFIQGTASGCFFVIATALLGNQTAAALRFGDLAAMPLAILLIIVASKGLHMDFNRLIYKTSFPVLAIGFALAAFLPMSPRVFCTVFSSGCVFIDLVLWSLGAFVMKNMGIPVVWIATLPGAALYLGRAFGAVSLSTVFSGFVISEPRLAAMTVALLLLASSLCLISEKNMKSGWGTFRIGSQESFATSQSAAVALIASERGLTSRESEVLALYAKGYGRGEAAEGLGVSEETVKTHVRSLYRKLDVHSREELVELVAQMQTSVADLDAQTGPAANPL